MAALYHVYSQTVADGTATSVVRPSDWNSAHLQRQTISGNTAGRSTWSGTNLVFEGGNNVTLSINSNTTASTVVINASFSQSAQTGSIIRAAVISGNTSGATASISSGTMVLSGGNNITLSQNGNTVAISAGAAGIQRISFSGNTAGLGPYLQGNTVTLTVGSGITASGINNLSVGLYGQNLAFGTATGANNTNLTATSLGYALTGPIQFATQGGFITISQYLSSQFNFSVNPGVNALSLQGNTTGTAGTVGLVDSGTLYLAGGSNITLSQNSNSVTINAAGAVLSGYNPYDRLEIQASSIGNGTVNVDPIVLPAAVQFNQFALPILITANATITNTYSLSYHVGIYTKNGDTLSSLITTSGSIAAPLPSQASLYTGMRMLTLSAGNTTLSAGNYWIVNLSSTTSAGAGAGSVWNMILSQVNTNYAGVVGATTNASYQMTVGRGVYSTTSNALPSTIALTQINGTASQVFRPQPIMLR